MDKATIKQVQAALKKLGYKLGPGGADGILGRFTTEAVAAFQKDKGLDIKWPGTIGPITLEALGIKAKADDRQAPPWYNELLRRAGLHEKTNNAALRKWLKSDGKTLGDPAKLPWCGDAIETPIVLTLPKEPMITNPYWALNWTKFGKAVPKGLLPLGAVLAFERPGGGHVGLLAGQDKTHYHVLGGNQDNRISIVRIAKKRCKGIRWPSTYPMPTVSVPITTINATISTNEA